MYSSIKGIWYVADNYPQQLLEELKKDWKETFPKSKVVYVRTGKSTYFEHLPFDPNED